MGQCLVSLDTEDKVVNVSTKAHENCQDSAKAVTATGAIPFHSPLKGTIRCARVGKYVGFLTPTFLQTGNQTFYRGI